MIYNTRGTCARAIEFEVTDDKVHNVAFIGGCPGNTIGVAKLVDGMEVRKAIDLLDGITCGSKSTSCPDQLAQALKQALIQA